MTLIPRRSILGALAAAWWWPTAGRAEDAVESAPPPDGSDPPREQAAAEQVASDTPPGIEKRLHSGRVVLLADALRRRDIRFTEEMESHVVLETESGGLHPILADWRGRAFYQDERLRDRTVHLVAFSRPGIPYLQTLTVFAEDERGRTQHIDYWCDICAIPMYEIKPCECCQGDIRLRFTPRGLPDDVPRATTEAK
ncbi:MAG: hypothetical protein KF774_15110 [Planctomyces sp.]|nr:hypothetical protein [Planctomyces sp.]